MNSSQNPLCDPNVGIDSAFIDKYSDLGEEVLTLFSKSTVYELIITSHNNEVSFKYKRSRSLSQWAPGIIAPINVVNYEPSGKTITIENVSLSLSLSL